MANFELFLLRNAVQSPKEPLIAHAFPTTLSISCPIVIRLGRAWGLMIISGRIPCDVNGISCSLTTIPIVPFCPALDENLSPNEGILSSLMRTLAMRFPFSSSVMNDLSTIPTWPFLVFLEISFRNSFPGTNALIPIKMVLSSMGVFSGINPCSFNLL